MPIGQYTLESLSAEFGISKRQILRYVHQNCLPRPLRLGPHPFVWTDEHYRRLRAIRRAREEQSIPLRERFALEDA